MGEYLLEVDGLCKSFGAVQANSDFNIKVRHGTIHALIGPNGAGKTTALNQLSGELIPDSGSIIFNAQAITGKKPYYRAQKGLARSFQITSIFEDMSVEENMALSIIAKSGHNFRFWQPCLSTPVVKNELAGALERIGLLERKTEKAGFLSHGEKKQLEVGMALSGEPKLLMLDEPMAGMGPGGTVEMSKLIQRLKKETTILLVEHDMEVVFALADVITVMVAG
ncbi:MAG: ABC transporter ATP-binding protein, partial [Desulfocapsaceae bacterium]|nr:ABC transporter ATP-binding protein [Desulfocapsaceae bacterium]